jgi:hypothetical protein
VDPQDRRKIAIALANAYEIECERRRLQTEELTGPYWAAFGLR